MLITFPSNTAEIVDSIRYAIGREVTFVTHTVSGCYNCSLDPITDTSVNSYCSVCSGKFWIPTYSGTQVSGHITWGSADILNWYSAGQQFDGDCRVQIKYTVANLDLVKNCDWIEVDDKKLQVKKTILRGIKPLNRILIDLIELEEDLT
jgi:hypothetical protein